ncbi:Hypothetical protein FKW44_005081, partial [Caligus rogercresseyi]
SRMPLRAKFLIWSGKLWDRRNLPGSDKGLLALRCFNKQLLDLRDQFIHYRKFVTNQFSHP